MKTKFKFEYDVENENYMVRAKLKSTGKWVIVGTCHISAREYIQRGERVAELLHWTYNP